MARTMSALVLVTQWSGDEAQNGLAAGRPELVREALPHLPAALEPEERILSLRGWLAAADGDQRAERRGLIQSIELNLADAPHDSPCHNRARSRQARSAGEFREKIRAIDHVRKGLRSSPGLTISRGPCFRAVSTCDAAGPAV